MKFSLASLCNCVKRLHPDLKQRVGSDTLKKYEKSLDSFTMYLHRLPDWSTFSCEDIDLLVMEFRTEMDLTKSQHITLVAALEFFQPNLKGNLVVCREALKGRANAEPTKHTVPLTTELALLFGAYMASKGKLKVGAAMILQQCTGLRPSELLALQQDQSMCLLTANSRLLLDWGQWYPRKLRESSLSCCPLSRTRWLLLCCENFMLSRWSGLIFFPSAIAFTILASSSVSSTISYSWGSQHTVQEQGSQPVR